MDPEIETEKSTGSGLTFDRAAVSICSVSTVTACEAMMARPLRIEFAGALYHVIARGNAQEDTYSDDGDRQNFLSLLQNTVNRYDWYCHAYCLMDNHYHLLIETGKPTLSKGMKYLNGTYTQYFNRQHQRVGHVFQDRFKAILVQERFLPAGIGAIHYLESGEGAHGAQCQRVAVNSYRATARYDESNACLTTECILAGFAKTKKAAQQRYRDFVQEGNGQPSPWQQLKNQIYLGDDDFVNDMQCKLDPEQSLKDIPKKNSPPQNHWSTLPTDKKLATRA